MVFDLAEASTAPGTMVLHQCAGAVHRPPHPPARGSHVHDTASAVPVMPPHLPGTPRPSRLHAAAQLNKRLHAVEAPSELREGRAAGPAAGGRPPALLARLPSLVARVRGAVRPQGDSHNDATLAQRLANVATSLPFLAIGGHMLGRHQTPEGRRYAASVVAVGAAATAYHASSGHTRRLLRKVDYYTITASSIAMLKALWPHKPLVHHALHASALAIPFKPFVLSTAHTLVMQAEFVRQAVRHTAVRPHLRRHLAAAAAGTALFALEDGLADSGFAHSHAAWHCLAAAAVFASSPLVMHKEQLRQTAAAVAAQRCAYHDSAMSLSPLAKR